MHLGSGPAAMGRPMRMAATDLPLQIDFGVWLFHFRNPTTRRVRLISAVSTAMPAES